MLPGHLSAPQMSFEELDAYNRHVSKLQDALLNADIPEFQRQYKYGKLLVSRGMYKQALIHLEKAMDLSKSVKANTIFQGVCIDIGTLLAQSYDYCGNIQKADEVYNELISSDANGNFIGDYAIFLHRRKRDFAKAQMFYTKSLSLFPKQSSMHLKYAGFLRHVKKDIKGAEDHYKKAIETNPLNADALGSYASFLHGISGNISHAQQLYEEAIRIDDTHTNNLCNYSLFLSEEKKNYELAETHYKRALEYSPKHANSLYNYAVMLDTHCKRKGEAETLYRRCIEEEPRHSFALYNIAVLLEEKYTQWEQEVRNEHQKVLSQSLNNDIEMKIKEVSHFYQRAVDADTKDATTMADCGRYMLSKMKEADVAYDYLKGALDIDPKNEVALYNLGILLYKHRSELHLSEDYLKKLVTIAPKHGAALQQLARINVDFHKATLDEGKVSNLNNVTDANVSVNNLDFAIDYYEKTLAVLPDPGSCALELIKVVSTYGTNRQRLRAIASVTSVLQTKKVIKEKEIFGMLDKVKVHN